MSVVDEYLAGLAPEPKAALETLRSVIVAAFPDVEEVISYGMPGFKYRGKYLGGYSAFKNHLSFFPTAHPIEVHHDKLSDFKLSKGTIEFHLDNPIDPDLIVALVKTRVDDIDNAGAMYSKKLLGF